MPRRFSNRKAKEYKAVLKAFGYSIVGYNGDDQIWKREGYTQTVRVPDRDNEDIIIPTSMEMLRKIAMAGISKKEILAWWKNNGYGD